MDNRTRDGPRRPKRSAREGSIRHRADGRWEARILLGYRDGKPIRPSFYGRTRREVDERLTKAKQEFKTGIFVAPERQTVEEFLTTWLDDSAKARVRPRTYDGYRQHIVGHIVPHLGRIQLQSLTPQHVQELIRLETGEGLAPRTVRGTRAVLRVALNKAMRWNVIPRNPATLVDLPRVQRHEPRVLDPEQARKLLKVATDHPLGCLFSVALAVGLRLGEALGLAWDDVDLEAKTLTVRRALQRRKKTVTFVEPKSEASRRTVTLPQFAVAALTRHRTTQKEDRLKAGGNWTDSGLVFTSPTGTPLDDSAVRKAFKALLGSAGLPTMRIHDLRHTCASLLLAQGVHPRLVMEMLGHSQINLTLDTYSHVIPAAREEAAKQMDALMASK